MASLVRAVKRLHKTTRGASSANQQADSNSTEQLDRYIAFAELVKNAGELAPFPYIKGLAGVALCVLQPMKLVKTNNEGLGDLAKDIAEILYELKQQALKPGNSASPMRTELEQRCSAFEKILVDMSKDVDKTKQQHRTDGRKLWSAKTIQDFVARYQGRLKSEMDKIVLAFAVETSATSYRIERLLLEVQHKMNNTTRSMTKTEKLEQQIPRLENYTPLRSGDLRMLRKIIDRPDSLVSQATYLKMETTVKSFKGLDAAKKWLHEFELYSATYWQEHIVQLTAYVKSNTVMMLVFHGHLEPLDAAFQRGSVIWQMFYKYHSLLQWKEARAYCRETPAIQDYLKPYNRHILDLHGVPLAGPISAMVDEHGQLKLTFNVISYLKDSEEALSLDGRQWASNPVELPATIHSGLPLESDKNIIENFSTHQDFYSFLLCFSCFISKGKTIKYEEEAAVTAPRVQTNPAFTNTVIRAISEPCNDGPPEQPSKDGEEKTFRARLNSFGMSIKAVLVAIIRSIIVWPKVDGDSIRNDLIGYSENCQVIKDKNSLLLWLNGLFFSFVKLVEGFFFGDNCTPKQCGQINEERTSTSSSSANYTIDVSCKFGDCKWEIASISFANLGIAASDNDFCNYQRQFIQRVPIPQLICGCYYDSDDRYTRIFGINLSMITQAISFEACERLKHHTHYMSRFRQTTLCLDVPGWLNFEIASLCGVIRSQLYIFFEGRFQIHDHSTELPKYYISSDPTGQTEMSSLQLARHGIIGCRWSVQYDKIELTPCALKALESFYKVRGRLLSDAEAQIRPSRPRFSRSQSVSRSIPPPSRPAFVEEHYHDCSSPIVLHSTACLMATLDECICTAESLLPSADLKLTDVRQIKRPRPRSLDRNERAQRTSRIYQEFVDFTKLNERDILRQYVYKGRYDSCWSSIPRLCMT